LFVKHLPVLRDTNVQQQVNKGEIRDEQDPLVGVLVALLPVAPVGLVDGGDGDEHGQHEVHERQQQPNEHERHVLVQHGSGNTDEIGPQDQGGEEQQGVQREDADFDPLYGLGFALLFTRGV
tara:strand:- start:217 stop:582 length:366 start_codon:yes stop_codon:yes gene_type:complete